MQPDQNNNVQPNYDFILNPQKPRKAGFSLGGASSSKRFIVAGGGFFLLLIFFLILKSLLSSGSINQSAYLSVLQDQQEILRILTTDLQNQSANINSSNQAFSQTTILSMNSYQASIISYLKTNGITVTPTSLAGKQSSLIDGQLTSAVSATNFNSIFQNIMSQQLLTYNSDLTKAYSSTTGPIGKNILQSQYKGTQLLIRELNNQYS